MTKKINKQEKKNQKWSWIVAMSVIIAVSALLVSSVSFLMWDRFSTQHLICGIQNLDIATGLVEVLCKR